MPQGQTPEQIDPAVTGRVPVLISHDNRYFQEPWQGMPLHGYTLMFEKMLDHENITVSRLMAPSGQDSKHILQSRQVPQLTQRSKSRFAAGSSP